MVLAEHSADDCFMQSQWAVGGHHMQFDERTVGDYRIFAGALEAPRLHPQKSEVAMPSAVATAI